jgi:uncharacterized protein YbaA (DUF1428 family)
MKKKSAQYVQSFVVPVPRKNIDRYKKWVKTVGPIWIEFGAIEVHDCVADDVKRGKVTSFPQSVKLKKGEVVCFGWVAFKSKAQLGRAMKQVMTDPRLAEFMNPNDMFFDGTRMFWGGFNTLERFS